MPTQQGRSEVVIPFGNGIENRKVIAAGLVEPLLAELAEIGVFGHSAQMVLPSHGQREKAVPRPGNDGLVEFCIGIEPFVAGQLVDRPRMNVFLRLLESRQLVRVRRVVGVGERPAFDDKAKAVAFSDCVIVRQAPWPRRRSTRP